MIPIQPLSEIDLAVLADRLLRSLAAYEAWKERERKYQDGELEEAS